MSTACSATFNMKTREALTLWGGKSHSHAPSAWPACGRTAAVMHRNGWGYWCAPAERQQSGTSALCLVTYTPAETCTHTTAETRRQQLKLTHNSWNKHTHNSCKAVFHTNQNTQIAVTLTITLIYAHPHTHLCTYTPTVTLFFTLSETDGQTEGWTDTHIHLHIHTHPQQLLDLSSRTRNVKHYLFMNLI